eukprot:12880728-Alexandrium_andersonii.AAC.1
MAGKATVLQPGMWQRYRAIKKHSAKRPRGHLISRENHTCQGVLGTDRDNLGNNGCKPESLQRAQRRQ